MRSTRRSPPGCAGPVLLTLGLSLLLTGCLPKQATAPDAFRSALKAAASPSTASPQTAYDKLPLAFEANQGQSDPQVKFLARGPGYSLFLTETEAVLTLRPETGDRGRRPGDRNDSATLPVPLLPQPPTHNPQPSSVLRMQLVGANPSPQVTAAEELPGKINHFLGNDPSKWRTNIPTYAKVRYANVYPGVDLVYYGNQRQLEYDFIIAPGTAPGIIRLAFTGAEDLHLDPQGDLVLQVASGTLRFQKPRIYQEAGGVKHEVQGNYVLVGTLAPDPRAPTPTVGFRVMAYDRTLPLIVDPGLEYSTFLGGSAEDQAHAIAVDAAGNAYVAGDTASFDFPTTPGAFDHTPRANQKAFITKLNSSGTALVYSTWLGGMHWGTASAAAIAVDSQGNAYVAGETSSPDFPITPGAFDPIYRGAAQGFVTKLNPSGADLIYSTFLGGSTFDTAHAIAVDATGAAYVAGDTASADFPATPGAFDRTCHACRRDNLDGFVAKLTPDGSSLAYATFLGGTGDDQAAAIAVDTEGAAYVAGRTESADYPGSRRFAFNGWPDAFVTKLAPEGSALRYSMVFGGGSIDQATAIAVDSTGSAYVAGYTYESLYGPDFPITPGAFGYRNRGGYDAFVTKLDPSGSSLMYSTLLGGRSNDHAYAIAVDSQGNAYVAGETTSTDFPITTGAFDPIYRGAAQAFVTKLNPFGTGLVYSTFLGGGVYNTASAIAVGHAGTVYVAGRTTSPDFPTTPYAYDQSYHGSGDAFVTKLDMTPGASLGLEVIPSVFYRSGYLSLMANVTASTPPMPIVADAYVALQVPDGSLLFLRGDGSFTQDIEPFVRNRILGTFRVQIFGYTFGGWEPLGSYNWLAALTEPGTLNIIGRIAWAPFLVVNP